MQLRWFLASAPALVFLASAAGAQSKSVLAREDAEFARRLFEGGFTELSAGLCGTIKGAGASGTELLEVQALEFELEVAKLRTEPDLVKRKSALRDVIARESTFLGENARTTVADAVRASLTSLYLEFAGALTAVLEGEQDAAQRAALVAEGEQVFAEGEKNLKERIKRFREQLDSGTNPSYAERQLVIALFSLPRLDYFHSKLYPAGSPERKQRLESALKGFEDFTFDYSDRYETYRAYIFEGLCHEALARNDDALKDYESAIALRESYDREGKVYLVGPEEADIVSGATLQLMQLLTRMKRNVEAVRAAEDFEQTIPDALATQSGLEIVAAKAEAQIGSGDISAAGATAQSLVDLDPQGLAGRKGREILARLPVFGLPPDKVLKIAETSANRGDFSRALDLLRRAREVVAGARDEHEIGAASFFLAGRCYASQGRTYEAAVAYDCAAQLYPNGSKAPEALNAAVNTYRELARKDRARFYSERADARMNDLAKRYPQHPLAANAGIWQGLKREDDGDFAGAIEFYSKVPDASPSHNEATFRLASATHQQAKALLAAGKADEAKGALQKAEPLYKSCMELLAKAQETTLDAQVLQKLAGFALNARLGLASLLLDLQRPGEVKPLLDELDKKGGLGPDSAAAVWSLKIRALGAQGKLNEATAMFEAEAESHPDAPGLASAAGVLANALDHAAADLVASDAKRAEELWRKAARSYWLSVKSALDGSAPLIADQVFGVAQRLYVIGLFFNKVPESQQTFVDWQGQTLDATAWEQAARIYERLDAQAPSYRVTIERARTLALLGKLAEAETIYARLFDQNQIVAAGTAKGFDADAVSARPELLSAYMEWGVSTHMVGLETKDQSRLDRAASIYQRMVDGSPIGTRTWWQAKYYLVKLLSDSGQYEDADTLIRSVKRTTDPRYDRGEFGFESKLAALEAELSKKVFRPK